MASHALHSRSFSLIGASIVTPPEGPICKISSGCSANHATLRRACAGVCRGGNALGNRAGLLPSSRRSLAVRAQYSFVVATAAAQPTFGQQMLVIVPPHPMVKHWVAILRNAVTPPVVFKSAMAELGRILFYEAVRDWLPMVEGDIETPCGVARVEAVDPTQPIAIVPVLRAGLALVDQIAPVIPHTVTYHVGCVRDEETLLPSMYLNKLPASFPPTAKVIIADPMLATGGTITAVLEEIISRGAAPQNIRVVCAVAAPPALSKLSEKYKSLRVYSGMIDPEVNEKGFIVPGFGDAGNRSFGTQ